jgi:hypothetical protein
MKMYFNHSLMMVLYSVILTFILYLIMFYILKQSCSMATDRSIVIGAVILIYLICFGTTGMNSFNKNLML